MKQTMKQTRSFILILFIVSFSITSLQAEKRPDNLAADEEVKKYRTSEIDPVIAKVPGYITRGIKSDPLKHLSLLVKFLKTGAQNDYHIVKRIHDWITDNIAYDTDKFYGTGSGTSSPYEIVKISRTTCGGFSALFKEMTRLAGLEAIKISGKSRNYINSSGAVSGHAWNAVKIGGRWYIVDSTADNRFGYKDKKFSEKNKYKSTSLFLHPRAKLLVNFPNNPEHFFTDTTLTLKEFLRRPVLTMNVLDYPGVTFTNLESIISKYDEEKEGGRIIKRFDAIRPHNGIVKFELKCPENILISVRLYDDKGKRCDFNTISYSTGDRAFCEFSVPKTGVFKGSIRAQYLNYEDTTHTLYQFKVISEKGPGPDLPKKNMLMKNSRFLYNKLQVLEDNFSTAGRDGYVRIKFKHPENLSLYSTLVDRENKKYQKNICYDIGKTDKTYYYSFPGKGTYRMKLYIKDKKNTEGHHQAAAVFQVINKNKKEFSLPPEGNILKYAHFSEQGFEILDSSLPPNKKNLYSIRIKAPDAGLMTCLLKNENRKNIPGHYIYNKKNNIYTFYFSAPEKMGSYTARIYHINAENKYKSICYFKIISRGRRGPYLPLPGTLHVQNESDRHSYIIMEDNFKTAAADGYYKIVLPEKTDVEYYLGLYNPTGKKFRNDVHASYERNKRIYYIVPHDKRYYHAKLYFKNPSRDKNYNKILYRFGIKNFQKKFKNDAPPFRLLIQKRFHKFGLKLIRGDVSKMSKTDEAVIKVRAPEDIKMFASLRDNKKKKYKDYYSYIRKEDHYYFTFKKPPGEKFTVKIYAKKEGDKNYNTVMKFYIE